MATTPEERGKGYGAALLQEAAARISSMGGTSLWCNARVPAAGFYQRFGFRVHGEAFDIAGIGPHLRMSVQLPAAR